MSREAAALPDRVLVTDVVTRDGLQDEERTVATADKLAVIAALVDAGVRSIEAASFVHPGLVPQMADADELMARLPRRPGIRYSVLVPNRKGAERALAAPPQEMRLVVSASEHHNRANLNRSVAESLAELREVVDYVRDEASDVTIAAGLATAFMCPVEGPVPADRLRFMVGELEAMDVESINLADTTGSANPALVAGSLQAVQDAFPAVELSLHLHDTLGRGLANVLAGLQAGVERFDASLGGLGGCPFAPGAAGNIATEDLVSMLHAMGVETGIDLDALIRASDLLPPAVGHALESTTWRLRQSAA